MLDRLRKSGFELQFTNHAAAILEHDFHEFADDLESALAGISIPITEIVGRGGGEAKSTQRLRASLNERGWSKHNFELTKIVDGVAKESITHEIDHVKRIASGTIAFEIEWNNKDPFFDRDLENFKRLHAEGAISIGGIVTRGSIMQETMRDRLLQFAVQRRVGSFQELEAFEAGSPTVPQRKQVEAEVARGRSFAEAWSRMFTASKYGQATTHWLKLMDRIARGVGNPCPLILVGLPESLIDMDS